MNQYGQQQPNWGPAMPGGGAPGSPMGPGSKGPPPPLGPGGSTNAGGPRLPGHTPPHYMKQHLQHHLQQQQQQKMYGAMAPSPTPGAPLPGAPPGAPGQPNSGQQLLGPYPPAAANNSGSMTSPAGTNRSIQSKYSSFI